MYNVLKIGMVFKNYKELCLFIGDSIKGGKAKRLQLEEWERNFKFIKKGITYTIIDILEKPLPKIDGRVFTFNYLESLERLLLSSLIENPNVDCTRVTLSKTKIATKLNLASYSFFNYSSRLANLTEFNVDFELIKEFYETAKQLIFRNIDATLNSLSMNQIISFRKVKYAVVARDGIKYNRITTEEENFEINAIKQEILSKYDIESESKLFNSKHYFNFYRDFHSEIQDRFNFVGYYSAYEIIIDNKKANSLLESFDNDLSVVRNGVHKRLMLNIENRNLHIDKPKYSYRWKDTYISDYELLIKYFILEDESVINMINLDNEPSIDDILYNE